MYRVLSFDGGGIRGLVTLAILQRLESAVPGLLARADLLAGTSTGGIIALGLAGGLSVEELIGLYRDNGEAIFDDSWLDNLRDLGGLSGADYATENLARLLNRTFGRKRLQDLGKRVLVPCFDLDNEAKNRRKRTWSPKFFHNFPGNDSDGKELLVDVALRTCAAPTYFPSYDGFIDGGVVANNPSMAALAQTQDARNREAAPPLGQVHLLSIGTGINLSYIEGRNLDWGLAQWARPLVNLLLDASMGIADYQCRQVLKDTYRRIAPVFPANENIKMDDWRRATDLIAFGATTSLADKWTGDDVPGWLKSVGW